jgi:hypothetical protein
VKYVYCLARPGKSQRKESHALPPGLDGTKIHNVSFRGISVLISDMDPNRIADSIQNATAHQKVVDAALRLTKSVIPCRFGTLFADNGSILRFIEENYAPLDAKLSELEGKIEVSVQAIFHTQVNPDPISSRQGDTGRSYLLRKKEQSDAVRELEEEADRLSRDINQALSPLWSDVKAHKRSARESLLLNICYLLAQQNLPALKLAYQEFRDRNPELKLLYTGPWAPYSFAEIDLRK